MSTELIVISQLPVIEEQLKALKERWEAKAAEAASLICTEETVQALKATRAAMRKEFEEADTQRKAVRARYMEPWDKVEATFKDCVKDAFTRADTALKGNIADFENELKVKCEADLREYFKELLAVEGIDFLTFEQAMSMGNIKISVGDAKRTTPRKLQDALAAVVSGVACDIETIDGMNADQGAAVMAEYKANGCQLNKAIAAVQAQIARAAAEREAAEARRAAQAEQQAAGEKVMAAAPARPVEAPQAPAAPADPVFESFTFTVYGARKSQLLKIRDYLKQEGIRYE